MNRYAKAIVALVVAVGAWAATALTDNTVTPAEWGMLGGAIATAAGVYLVPNRPSDAGAVSVLELLVLAVLVILVLALAGAVSLH